MVVTLSGTAGVVGTGVVAYSRVGRSDAVARVVVAVSLPVDAASAEPSSPAHPARPSTTRTAIASAPAVPLNRTCTPNSICGYAHNRRSSDRCPAVMRIAAAMTRIVHDRPMRVREVVRSGGLGSAAVRVLVIGAGGREHALCVALADDPAVSALSCAPGNAGSAVLAPPSSAVAAALDVDSPEQIATLARDWAADLVVIGPEAPLVAGAADAVRAVGIPCFGPSIHAAALEGSKSFAKGVMSAAGVPTADAATVTTADQLGAALGRFGAPYVVKDDGLAAGKGVLVTDDIQAAGDHGRAILAAGNPVVVEDYLDGPEVSLFAVTDGTTVLPLQPAQDFKRIGDGDTGPNTGGMGAYSPLPWAPADLVADVVQRVLQPTVDELRRRGTPFSGLLYAGLALTSRGLRVVEFNARFGDPETQVVLPLLATPLSGLLYAAATGSLAEHPALQWHSTSAVAVVVAAPGYPEGARTGQVVLGADGPAVRHAGTQRREDGAVIATGGRVLAVVGMGADLSAARRAAYESVEDISFDGAYYRTDIALTAVDNRIAQPSSVAD